MEDLKDYAQHSVLHAKTNKFVPVANKDTFYQTNNLAFNGICFTSIHNIFKFLALNRSQIQKIYFALIVHQIRLSGN